MIASLAHKIGRHVFRSSNTPLRFISSQFVPAHEPLQEKDIQSLENFLSDKPNILVLTGAGISTESGRWT